MDLVLGKKQSYKAEAVSQAYTGHGGIVASVSNAPNPTDPWAHVHNPAKRSDPGRHLKDAAAMRVRNTHTHTRAAAVAAAKSSLVVPFGRLLLLRVLFLLLLLPLATFFEPC